MVAMVDRESFGRLVREAVSHLYDRPFLESHPLGALLAGRSDEAASAELQRVLLAAIEDLKPSLAAPPDSLQWRQYRYLRRRYVEGAPLDRIVDEMAISDRQTRRYNQEALDAVADALWARYSRRAIFQGRGSPPPGADAGDAVLAAELASMASASPGGSAPVADTLNGALATVADLLKTRRVAVEVSLPSDLPPVGLHRVVFRQILLGLLVHAAECHAGARVKLIARPAGQAVEIRTVVRYPAGSRPCGARGDDLLSAPSDGAAAATALDVTRRLVATQNGSLELRADGPDREELRLALPAFPLTRVLVIDDNLDFQRLFQRFLEDSPYRAIYSQPTDDLVRLALEQRPGVIILDVMMPTQDGWEVLQALKSHQGTRTIPVIVCSVLRETTLAVALGADGVLTKPIARSDVLAALERCRLVRSQQDVETPLQAPHRLPDR